MIIPYKEHSESTVHLLKWPLYRHSEEMIKKLESAGLGFYVKATETQEKLGECVLAV